MKYIRPIARLPDTWPVGARPFYGGGKTSTTTSATTIPSQVLAQYQNVNNLANSTAQQPFQTYGGEFVAPINSTEQAGITQAQNYSEAAQPYYQQASGIQNQALGYQNYAGDIQNQSLGYQNYAGDIQNQALGWQNYAGDIQNQSLGWQNYAGDVANQALGWQNYAGDVVNNSMGYEDLASNAEYGAAQQQDIASGMVGSGIGPANASNLNGAAINKYLSPYLGTVLNSTESLVNQQNQQQQAGQLGNAISSGAFGGDRTGIAAANLAQQEELAGGNLYSGIANQGYNNALATAQQQQGVNLSAQQANLARILQGAGLQSSIGSAKGQLGAYEGQIGNNSANMGNMIAGMGNNIEGVSQGIGQLGNNIAGVGNNVGGIGNNIAGVGNNVGQLGNNIAGVGNNVAGEGNNIAGIGNNVAGLGTAVQTSGESGAASTIAAGQTAQQTQQAQDTAAYNQFLQQQGYPFQVDQFLANIAEGTGSLSGSTTSTQQPAPFFSDERLKEDIEPIGTTFDGENIVKFRYKGSPQKHIGLLAQDVEKHHPEAVGLAGGYKTVDYDAATKEAAGLGAAKRYASGGYADGGQPIGAGGGPADYYMLQQILQNAHNMQGMAPGASMMPQGETPYGGLKTLGSLLASSNGSPRRIASQNYTPPIKQPDSIMSQLNQAAGADNSLKTLGTDAKGVYDFANNNGLGGASSTTAPPATLPDGRALYASGGSVDPYGDDGGYVPSSDTDSLHKDIANFQKMQGKPPGAPQSGLGALNSAAGTANNVIGLGKNVAEASPYAAGALAAVPGAMGAIGSDIAAAFPFLLLASGGMVRKRGAGGETDDFLPGDDTLNDSLKPFPMPALSKGETGQQSPMGHPALDTANPPIPPERPRDLGTVAPPQQQLPQQRPGAPRAGLGGASMNDNAPPMVADKNRYEGQTLLNPAGISDNSGATAGGLGRAAASVASAPQSMADAVWGRMVQQESGGRQFDKNGNPLTSKTGAIGIAQIEPSTGPQAAKEAGLPWDPARLANDPNYGLALGKAHFNALNQQFGSPELAAAAYNAGPTATANALAKAQANGDSYLKHLPAETQAYVANVAGNGAPASGSGSRRPAGQQVAQNDTVGGLGGALGGIGDALTNAGNGVGDYFNKNQSWLVPALSFLGTMASSNSRYLGAAALQGLGGAANSYENVQNQQTQRNLEQSHTGLTQADTAGRRAQTARDNIWSDPVTGRTYILGPDGKPEIYGAAANPTTGSVSVLGGPEAVSAQRMGMQPNAAGAAGAPAPPPPPAPPAPPTLKGTTPTPQTTSAGMLGPAARATMAQDAKTMMMTPPSADDIKISGEREAQVNQNGDAAVSQGHMLNQLAAELTAMSDEGLSGGSYNALKVDTLQKYNDLVATIGHPEWKVYDQDIAHNAAAGKISQTMQFAMSHGSEQNSSLALQAAALATPSAHYDKQSAAEMLAGLYVDKQGAINRQQYLKQYRNELANQNPIMAKNYRAQNALQAFNQDHNDTQYGQEKEKLAKFLAFPESIRERAL